MKVKISCFGFFLVICIKSICQQPDVDNLLKLTLANPGLSYEMKIGKLQSFYVHPFMKTSMHLQGGSFLFIPYNVHTHYFFDPALALQFRQYYQTGKQKRKQKDYFLNNMNFVALYEEMFYTKKPLYRQVSKRKGYNKIALVWGLQTNITPRVSFNSILGYGYLFPLKPFYYSNGEKMEEMLMETPIVQLTFSLLLKKKTGVEIRNQLNN